jgi:hypothetical protein
LYHLKIKASFMARILHFSTKKETIKMIYRVFIVILFQFFWISSSYAQFFTEGHVVRDVKNNIIWLRCTVGQVWNYDTNKCDGEIAKLNHAEIKQAVAQASDQLGGSWRLPTLEELEGLVCEQCTKPKVREKIFPGLSPEAYWTGTKNRFNSRMYWSVNFMTGHNYSRFFSYQQLPVMLVQDR